MSSHPEGRGSFRQRGYTAAWDRAATAFKNENPLCRGCLAEGRVSPAELVDHVVPHRGNDELFWDQAHWQSSCRWHHDVIKQRLERMFDEGSITAADLWLDSEVSKALSRRTPRKPIIGLDGWPT